MPIISSSDSTKFLLPTFIINQEDCKRILLKKITFPTEFNNVTLTGNSFQYLVLNAYNSYGKKLIYSDTIEPSYYMYDLYCKFIKPNTYIDADDIIKKNFNLDIEYNENNPLNIDYNIQLTSKTINRYGSNIQYILSPIENTTLQMYQNIKLISLKEYHPLSNIYYNIIDERNDNLLIKFAHYKQNGMDGNINNKLGFSAPTLNCNINFNSLVRKNIKLQDFEFIIKGFMHKENILSYDEMNLCWHSQIQSFPVNELELNSLTNPYQELNFDYQIIISNNGYKIRLPFIFKKENNKLKLINTDFINNNNYYAYDKISLLNSANESILLNEDFIKIDKLFKIDLSKIKTWTISAFKTPYIYPLNSIKLYYSTTPNYELFLNNTNTTQELISFNVISNDKLIYGINLSFDINIEIDMLSILYFYLSDDKHNYAIKNNINAELEYEIL